MQRWQRPVAVLAAVAAAVLVADGAVAAIDRHHGQPASEEPVAPHLSHPSTTALPPGEAIVTGTQIAVHAIGATGSPVAVPIVVTVPARGQGQVVLTRIRVLDQAATISWGGGQPLPINGRGSLDLGPTTVDADASGVTWHLDGRPRFLTPGEYTINTDVGVSTGGALAQAEQIVTFLVPSGTTGQLESVGDAQFHSRMRALNLTGPGQVTLTGNLTVRGATGIERVQQVVFGPGPFQLQLTPAFGGFTVSGLLQGPFSTS